MPVSFPAEPSAPVGSEAPGTERPSQRIAARGWRTYLFLFFGFASLVLWLPAFLAIWYVLDAVAPASQDDNQFGPYGAALWGMFALPVFFVPVAVNFFFLAGIPAYRKVTPWCIFIPTWPATLIAMSGLAEAPSPWRQFAGWIGLVLLAEIAGSIWWSTRDRRRRRKHEAPAPN